MTIDTTVKCKLIVSGRFQLCFALAVTKTSNHGCLCSEIDITNILFILSINRSLKLCV